MSSLFVVLLFMSICFSLPQSNFVNGVGSEYEALLISSLLINKIEDFSSLWFSPLSCNWQWSAGKIAGSANNIVTKPRGGSQWCSRTPDKDLAASRLQLQTRAGDTPSPSNICSREAIYPTAPCCGWSLHLKLLLLPTGAKAVFISATPFLHHYMNSECVLNHIKRMGDTPIYSGELLWELSDWISRCSFEGQKCEYMWNLKNITHDSCGVF